MPPSLSPPKGCDRHHPTPCYPLSTPQRHRCRGNTEGFSTVSGESGWGLHPGGEGPKQRETGGGSPVVGVSAELGKMEGVEFIDLLGVVEV